MAGSQRENIETIDLPYASSTVTGTECIPLSYAEDIQIRNHLFFLSNNFFSYFIFTVYFVFSAHSDFTLKELHLSYMGVIYWE